MTQKKTQVENTKTTPTDTLHEVQRIYTYINTRASKYKQNMANFEVRKQQD